MKKRILLGIVASVLMGVLTGCQLTDNQGSGEDKNGMTALEAWKLMSPIVKEWHEDAVVIQFGSTVSNKTLSLEGKSRGWDAQVYSPSAKSLVVFAFNAANKDTSPLGAEHPVTNESDLPYVPLTMETIQQDSSDVYMIAEDNGGAEKRASGENIRVQYILHYSPKYNVPVWDVLYRSKGSESYDYVVDAASGVLYE